VDRDARGRTGVIGAFFPERLPVTKVERHAALCIDDHGEGELTGDGVEELGAGVAHGVGGDVEELWRAWWWRNWIRVAHSDQ